MPGYRAVGSIPEKRHIQHRREIDGSFKQEGLYYEHVVTTRGFDNEFSILYHLRPPTRVTEVERLADWKLEEASDLPLRHVHLKTGEMPRVGDMLSGRVAMMFNEDIVASRCRPEADRNPLYRNGACDEVVFINNGSGVAETQFGNLRYRRGDYIVIPRTTIYRLCPDDPSQEDYLILESTAPVKLPARYFNPDGQLQMGAPYSERDFHTVIEPAPIDDKTETQVIVKDGLRISCYTLAHHPLDVVGWDGYLYPYTFNAWDFEPLTGTVHLPPPFQQTFETDGFVICTFAPRHMDHHPHAIKVPYAHSNVQADEVLFYVDGQFGSRRGVEIGSFTLHPGGIPHGPHPGTIMASMNVERTEEMAVMFDTTRPLKLTANALSFDDPTYPQSWL